jgi:hypothetical protein
MSSPTQSPPRGEADDWKPHVVIGVLIAIVLSLHPLQPGSFGTIDFIQYWSAWELMAHGRNPYDPSLLHATQSALIDGEARLVYSWNPPWTYTLLAPFLSLPFPTSATFWLVFEVLALLFIAAQTPKAIKVASLGPLWSIVATLAFLPTLFCLRYGQLGVLFTLAITLFLLAVNSQRFFLAGVSLLPLSAKPHLFLLCLVPGLVWLLQIPREAAKRFLVGAIGGGAVLVCLTLLVEPLSLRWWLAAMTADPSASLHLVPVQNWMPHTTATSIRVLIMATMGHNPTWPLIAVPLVSVVTTALYFLWRRQSIDWSTLLPPLLCLSLGTSSYGWIHDQTPLVLCQYLLLSLSLSATSRARPLLLALSISAQAVPLMLTVGSLMNFYWFFIVPWLYFGLLVAIPKLARAPDAPTTDGATRSG